MKFSNKPLDYVYAIVWFGIFAAFSYYIFSGKMFLPDENGNIYFVAILVGWIAEYLTQIGTGILFVGIGLIVSLLTVREK